jgi:hypothetical protein
VVTGAFEIRAYSVAAQMFCLLVGGSVRSTLTPQVVLSILVDCPFVIGGWVILMSRPLWDWNAFLHSAVWLQFRQPWRDDALSFAVLLDRLDMPKMPWLGFAASGVALLVVMWRRNCDIGVFARDVGLVLFAFFALNKQTFYNYYFLVLGALCCALAVSGRDRQTVEDTECQKNSWIS